MDQISSEYQSAFKSIPCKVMPTTALYQNGPPIDPLKRILTYDSSEWEMFVDEWVYSLKDKYIDVIRPTGAGDKGIDVAGFTDEKKLNGVWHNHQCKFYKDPLAFGDIAPEIGKTLWYSFNGYYLAPVNCYFIAPKGASTDLTLLISNIPKLKTKIIDSWQSSVANKITKKQEVALEGQFLEYVDAFDFRIFSVPNPRQILEQHKKTLFHRPRFGGGIPPRPQVGPTPDEIGGNEIIYTKKLIDAYSDHKGESVSAESDLSKWPHLRDHFRRSRESFYCAESLRIFIRELESEELFKTFQDQIYLGVIDTCDGNHTDAFERVKAVTKSAQSLALDAHPLNQSAFPTDRLGICHQLANDERLTWKK